jgi:hypothetical protein
LFSDVYIQLDTGERHCFYAFHETGRTYFAASTASL